MILDEPEPARNPHARREKFVEFEWGWLVLLGLAVAASIVGMWRLRRRESRTCDVDFAAAKASFQQRREWLEARFLTQASQSGKPRGLAWADCDFGNPVAWARDRESGELRALVGVTIRFEAVEGGGMENNPNVGNLRAATAVFRLRDSQWESDGRALFNLSPAQAIEHFQHELETVD